ncbi:uncharacterized protein isoform X2 [Rhodnius prolixus]
MAMSGKKFDMSQIKPEAFCGKVKQAKKLAELEKKLEDMKIAFVKDGIKTHKRFLAKKNRRIQAITKDLMQSKPDSINQLLSKDPEVHSACKGKATNELIETIEGLLFKKRKRLDKLNFKLNKLKEEYYLVQIDLKKTNEPKKPSKDDKLIKACQDAEVDLQNLKTEKETALIVLNAYKKLLDVLHRDSQCFDTIISRYKAYVLLRAEFAFYILKLLKWAIFDSKTLEESSKVSAYLRWEVISKQISTFDSIKAKFSRIRSKVPKPPKSAVEQFDLFKEQAEQFQQYSTLLESIRNKWEDYFQEIRDACRVSKDSEILSSIENILEDKCYLLKQIEINNLLLDNYTRRRKYLQQTFESLLYSMPESTKKNEMQIAEMADQKVKLEEEYEKAKTEWFYMPKDLHPFYQTMYNLNNLLKLIAAPPHKTYKSNQEICMKYGSKELETIKKPAQKLENERRENIDQSPEVYDESLSEKECPAISGEKGTSVEKFDLLEDEYKVPYVFDGIILKVKLLLRQLGNDPNIIYKKPSKKERRAFKKYLENNVSSQVCPGTAIEIGEEEEEGEREEKDE